jgi:uncharacterized integral membrane protein
MIIFALALLLGLSFAFFAMQNTAVVPLSFGAYSFQSVPLYIVVIGSLLTGLLIAWVFNFIDSLGSLMSLRGKDRALHTADKKIAHLEDRIHDLELENAKLAGEHKESHLVDKDRYVSGEEPTRRAPIFQNFFRRAG